MFFLLQAIPPPNIAEAAVSSPGDDFSPEHVTTGTGLIFEQEFVYRLDDNSYTDIIQLNNLSDQIQALQFRLSVNRTSDDSTLLIFDNIQKGADISDTSWILTYNVFSGTPFSNGASKDSVYVLLYNLDQNGGLLPGDYSHLLNVNYRTADLPAIHDSLKSSFRITYAQASTYQGQPVDITPSRNELTVIFNNTVPVPDQGLIFEKDTVYRLEDNFYTDIMQLKGLEVKAQALQFRLQVNKAADDNLLMTFANIEKGSDVSNPSWALDYNVFRGPLTANGASLDSIYVLLYNLNQDGGLPAGDYNDLLRVKYRVADLGALQDSLKSSFRITDAIASTYQGYPVNITPSRNELAVIALNRVGFYGDVNGDGCLDILDILMIVDHIVGRDSLETDEFERADIAPWLQGQPDPEPDGFVNVQDLSVLQHIILTGIYPSGIPINGCSYVSLPKSNNGTGTGVKIYIHDKGITIYLNSDVDIRGVQLELANVRDDPHNMEVSTDLGRGYYYYGNNSLRVLLYDRNGNDVFSEGGGLLADLPFTISDPENISVEKFLLVDKNMNMITENNIEIIYNTPSSIPLDYVLEQNYPNPFNPKTTIQYSVPDRSLIVLKVYDVLGNEVASPVNEVQNRGNYSVVFTPNNLSSGVYFYRFQASPIADNRKSFIQSKKMVFLK